MLFFIAYQGESHVGQIFNAVSALLTIVSQKNVLLKRFLHENLGLLPYESRFRWWNFWCDCNVVVIKGHVWQRRLENVGFHLYLFSFCAALVGSFWHVCGRHSGFVGRVKRRFAEIKYLYLPQNQNNYTFSKPCNKSSSPSLAPGTLNGIESPSIKSCIQLNFPE